MKKNLKNKKNILIFTLLIVNALILLSGCQKKTEEKTLFKEDSSQSTSEISLIDNKKEEITEIKETETSFKVKEEPIIKESSEVDITIPKNSNNIDKYTYIVDSSTKEKNVLFSPLSLDMALGLLNEGSPKNSETNKEISTYLNNENYSEFSKEYLNYVKNNYNDSSDNEYFKYENKLELANSIWLSTKYSINNEYKETLENYFSSECNSLDFSKAKESSDIVNNWCNEKTYGLIPKVINEDSITKDSSAILVNSLYFESAWETPWDETDEYFVNLDGTKSEKSLLYQTVNKYYENDFATGFGCLYQDGISFIGILPKKEGDFNLSDLDIKGFLESEDNSYDSVYAYMPELNYEYSFDDLTPTLKNLGINKSFSPKAEFDLITNEDNNFYVDKILQKCKIELDKDGTRAAAVTTIMMLDACNIDFDPPKTVEVKINRPYAYLIYDNENDQILFMGKVVDID